MKKLKHIAITLLLPLFAVPLYSGYPGAGTCLKLDGMDDYVECTNYLSSISIPFSFEAWLYYSDNTDCTIFTSEDPSALLDPYAGFFISMTTNNKIQIHIGNGIGNASYSRRGVEANNAISKNQWVNIACVVTNLSNNIKIYFNGIEQTVTYMGSGLSMGHKPAYVTRIGRKSYWALQYAKMKIEEIRVWNRALSQAEIRNNMCQKLKGNETGLVGYWRMDEGSGNKAYDSSGNGNHGTLN